MEDHQNCSTLFCTTVVPRRMRSHMNSSFSNLGLHLNHYLQCFVCLVLTRASLFVLGLVSLCFCVYCATCYVLSAVSVQLIV